MLSKERNARIARSGSDESMGRAMRRYWAPVLPADEAPTPGGAPVRITLFNEDLVLFRTGAGELGLIDEYCRHRGASLALGRVDECGIRCIYHGWLFGPDGTVLETPNVNEASFRTRFKAFTYSVREAGGLIWAYLGPPEQMPELPHWPWFDLSAANVIATRHFIPCNYVQVIEGLVDSAHLGILHGNALTAAQDSDLNYARKVGPMQFDKAPRLEVQSTDFGFRYAAIRSAGDHDTARVTSFVAPFTVVNPNGDVVTIVVPARDDLSMFFHVFWDEARPLGEEPMRSQHLKFIGLDAASLDAIGARVADDPAAPAEGNGYHQDRVRMAAGSFSGLPGLIAEDVIVSAASGPLRDRSKEFLSGADMAVAELYRTLLAVADAGETGAMPRGADFAKSGSMPRGFDIADVSQVDWKAVA